MKNNFSVLMELLWMFIAVISLIIAVYSTIAGEFVASKTIPLYIISILCFAMYLFRKKMRKKREKEL